VRDEQLEMENNINEAKSALVNDRRIKRIKLKIEFGVNKFSRTV
jgi:anti-sigma28 factor (negative regulator of flagellin synthesis)